VWLFSLFKHEFFGSIVFISPTKSLLFPSAKVLNLWSLAGISLTLNLSGNLDLYISFIKKWNEDDLFLKMTYNRANDLSRDSRSSLSMALHEPPSDFGDIKIAKLQDL
jgi:hypothetical protein